MMMSLVLTYNVVKFKKVYSPFYLPSLVDSHCPWSILDEEVAFYSLEVWVNTDITIAQGV